MSAENAIGRHWSAIRRAVPHLAIAAKAIGLLRSSLGTHGPGADRMEWDRMAFLRRRRWWTRLLAILGAGLRGAVLVALALTMVDLDLTGLGQPLLSRPWLDIEGLVFISAGPTRYCCSPRCSDRRSRGVGARRVVPDPLMQPTDAGAPLASAPPPGDNGR